tara:strand:- start:1055 stop:1207 length:153 start_codon:yes stop_codon:yes gene_type:complete
MNGLPKSSIDITLKLGNLVNISEFMVVGADVPVPPLGIGNMFASQCNLLS